MAFFSTSKKIGILGGGQLGKMVLDVSNKWGVTVYVLDPDRNSPSSKLCSKFFHGDLMDFDTVVNFGKQVDIITIEIENVNVEALKFLESLNKKIIEEIEKDGRIFLSGTIIDKENVLRINCINHRRNKKDIDFLIRVFFELCNWPHICF